MPKPQESRAIHHFINSYNSFCDPKIIKWNTDLKQESPDAICELSCGQRIALEHTSVYPPKQANVTYTSPKIDLSPLSEVLNRKLLNDYRSHKIDTSWLLVQIRPTLPIDIVIQSVKDRLIPKQFGAVFLEWPVLQNPGQVVMGIYELRRQSLWLPPNTQAA